MPNPNPLHLDPKTIFQRDPRVAATHCDLMATPQFQSAAATAMLSYQFRVTGGDPQVLTIAAAKLRGAQEFLRELMTLGVPETQRVATPDAMLRPPEETLDRPYVPPQSSQ